MKKSISKKYAVAFIGISLLVGTVVAVSLVTLFFSSGQTLYEKIEFTERQIFEESQGKSHQNIARYLSTYLFVPLYQIDIDGINRLIGDMKQAINIESILIADAAGKVLTDGTKQNNSYGMRLDISELGPEEFSRERMRDGERITFAIKAGNYKAGYGQIVFSDGPLKSAVKKHQENLLSSWHNFIADFTRISILAFGVVLLIASFLIFHFSRTLSRPLMTLKEATDRVSRGDLNHRVSVASDDEIGALAESFNRMVSDLNISTSRLRNANEKLRELDRLKSEFISMVSHELRTPITSVKAFAELILLKPDIPFEKQKKFLEIIKEESERLARMINDILDLTKIESGRLHWRIQEVAIRDVILHSVRSIDPLAVSKDLVLEADLDPELPSLNGDKDRLVQVVTNILSNAVKFTPSGGSIKVRAYREDGPVPAVAVSVADTGIGIPPESLPMIFEKFHRAVDDLALPVEGTGLGLAISRHIVEYHEGVMCAESTPGKGSTFTFILPLENRLAVRC